MCGFVGFTNTSPDSKNILSEMTSKLSHRGPDSSGLWVSNSDLISLGHTRLSIQDLSQAGHQPMVSECQRYVLAYNGEIYNHLELRKELINLGHNVVWKGHSDTETLLVCLSILGKEKTLELLVGMFSFAFFDRHNKTLLLARDRFGEKPLYWGWSNNILLFGSELKAIKAHPGFIPKIDRTALSLYLRYCYVPSPLSIYEGIFKLLPGHFIELPLGEDIRNLKTLTPSPYWSVDNVVSSSLKKPFQGSAQEAIKELDTILRQTISGQLLADVDVGAFLSGGIDSSLIVSLMQAESKSKVKTFTIGFNEKGFNEAHEAKKIAKHIGTDHHELYVSATEAQKIVPKLPQIYCEPFADSSQIPTFLVSEMTKKYVTVALSGDGGDELFGGYNRYLSVENLWNSSKKYPKFLKYLGVNGLRMFSQRNWDNIFNNLNIFLPSKYRLINAGEKARKLSEVLMLENDHDYYKQLTSHWINSTDLVIDSGIHEFSEYPWHPLDSMEHAMMSLDAKTYLSDDILAKVDRAAMANSLETRVPMLDQRVFEFAWKLPLNFKINKGQSKWILRQLLYNYVPRHLIERPKAGFGIPLAEWLRGPLKEWAESLINPQRLKEEGFFHPEEIWKKWIEHQSGDKNWQHHLWNILMFQAWLEDN